MRQQEVPISPVWLDFHDRYAGSFDVKVEQNALIMAFMAKGRFRFLHGELRDPVFAEQVQPSINSRLEEAASDQFSQFYLSDKFLVRVETKTGKFVYGWEHT